MAIAFAFDEAELLSLAVWVGTVTADDWRAQASRRVTDPALVAAQRLFVDVRLWTPNESIGKEVIREVAQRYGTSGVPVAGKKLALVAEAGFWDARMFEDAMSEYGAKTIVFNDLDTACTWLGIDSASTRQRVEQMVAALREAVE